MPAHLRFRRVSRALCTAVLAATATSCGGTAASDDPVGFTDNACATQVEFNEFIDVTPASPVDFLAVRSIPRDGESFEPRIGRSVGTPCATASNVTACQDALAALPTSGWYRDGCLATQPTKQFVFTRGDVVGAITTHAELVEFLGTVDSVVEAALLVMYGEDVRLTYFPGCSSDNARTVEGGFELLMHTRDSCGDDSQIETLFFVATDGTVTLLDTRMNP